MRLNAAIFYVHNLYCIRNTNTFNSQGFCHFPPNDKSLQTNFSNAEIHFNFVNLTKLESNNIQLKDLFVK